jgi:hypothetical protein
MLKPNVRCPRPTCVRTSLVVLLIASLTGLLGIGDPARAEPRLHDYVGAEKCKTCHQKKLMGNQYAVWQAGPHRQGFTTLKSEASVEIAASKGLETAPHESPECLRCHVAAWGVPLMRLVDPIDRTLGVQCESCHGPGRDYRKKKIMSKRKTAERKGLFDPARDAAICTACHNEDSPTFDPSRYELSDGSASGFDFELAKRRILHEIPADVKGNFIELEEKQKAAEKAKAATR